MRVGARGCDFIGGNAELGEGDWSCNCYIGETRNFIAGTRDFIARKAELASIIMGGNPENEESPIMLERSEAVTNESNVDNYGRYP